MQRMMKKCIIAAVAEDGAIGKDNGLLWHLPEDLKYFKKVTMGCPVIMGRRTFESIGRALPGRHNIVVSRTWQAQGDGPVTVARNLDGAQEDCPVTVVRNLDGAFRAAERDSDSGKCFVIGGAQLYAEAISKVDRLYITRIHASAPDADSFFPAIDKTEWSLESASELHTDPETGITYTFEIQQRVR